MALNLHSAGRCPPAWLVFVIVLFALTVPAAARTGVGSVAGTVVFANGSPVAGAGVTIETAEGSHPHFTKCDLHGRFVFSRYSRGQYNLRAYAGGRWSEWIRNVAVKPGKTTEVRLHLPPASRH